MKNTKEAHHKIRRKSSFGLAMVELYCAGKCSFHCSQAQIHGSSDVTTARIYRNRVISSISGLVAYYYVITISHSQLSSHPKRQITAETGASPARVRSQKVKVQSSAAHRDRKGQRRCVTQHVHGKSARAPAVSRTCHVPAGSPRPARDLSPERPPTAGRRIASSRDIGVWSHGG